MNMLKSRAATLFAASAALAMTATPVLAQSWGGGWGGRRHHDVDAGDVITGILILGGIAAVASAASNSGNRNRDRSRDRDYDNRDYQYRDSRDYRDDSGDYRNDTRPTWQGNRAQSGLGIDAAVDRCVSEIERGQRRVDTVDAVSRDGQGWQVAGQTNGGDPYACAVGSDGRIRSATVNGTAA